MLIGEYHTKIGAKNRTAIPNKLRKELGRNLIITRGYENCLILVDKKRWSEIAKDVMNGSFINKNIRDTTRFLVGSASELNPDAQGRVVLPSSLCQHAKLNETKDTESEIVFIGLINWVEVWSKKQWLERVEYLNQNADKIADELSKPQINE